LLGYVTLLRYPGTARANTAIDGLLQPPIDLASWADASRYPLAGRHAFPLYFFHYPVLQFFDAVSPTRINLPLRIALLVFLVCAAVAVVSAL